MVAVYRGDFMYVFARRKNNQKYKDLDASMVCVRPGDLIDSDVDDEERYLVLYVWKGDTLDPSLILDDVVDVEVI